MVDWYQIDHITGFTESSVASIHEKALRVLATVGVKIYHPQLIAKLKQAKIRTSGNCVYLERTFIKEQLTSNRQAQKQRVTLEPKGRSLVEDGINVCVGDMPQFYLDPETEKILPMTTENAIRAIKFLDAMRTSWKNVEGGVPAIPTDIPSQLLSVVEYYLGCEYSSDGGSYDTLQPIEALPYIYRMAEATNRPIQHAHIYVNSPLKVGGKDLDTLMYDLKRWETLSVESIPLLGSTGPIWPKTAFTLAVAEVIAAACILHFISHGKAVNLQLRVWPFDFRTLAISAGSPEWHLLKLAEMRINQHYNVYRWLPRFDLLTMAKDPGLQAGLEKGAAAGLAIALGIRNFNGVGLLSFDDIFSPEQMVADIELREYLQRFRSGLPSEKSGNWLTEIKEGIAHGYFNTDTSLDHYQEIYTFPKIFDRTSYYTFIESPVTDARKKVRQEAIDKLRQYEYNPPEDTIRKVRYAFKKAWENLGGNSEAPIYKRVKSGFRL